ncbi:hypothetical protein WA026_006271 [Henosepilachna vigintioctopunctata]|uniref:Uncharacterized protein n=1 Tax=Henosepilachna vigintioctopunctata TaxID=420089 RepID=A0AAW1TQY8_9CUCU
MVADLGNGLLGRLPTKRGFRVGVPMSKLELYKFRIWLSVVKEHSINRKIVIELCVLTSSIRGKLKMQLQTQENDGQQVFQDNSYQDSSLSLGGAHIYAVEGARENLLAVL